MKNYKICISALFVTLCISTKAYSSTGLTEAVAQYNNKDYSQAAVAFFKLGGTTSKLEEKEKARYYLGLSLAKLKLFNAAAYPLIETARGKSTVYRKKALQKLIEISAILKDPRLLDIAVQDIKAEDLSNVAADVYYNNLGVYNYDNNQLDKAIENLKKSLQINENNENAYNLLALSYLRKNNTEEAIKNYEKLLNLFPDSVEFERQRSYTLLNMARAYFQAKKFQNAIEVYQKIKKTNPAYIESMTEQAWAYLHLGKLNDGLSVVQSLHTPYFENNFDPESVFLRAVFMNYTCQVDEADSVMKSFNENFNNIIEIITNWLDLPVDTRRAFTEIDYAVEELRTQSDKMKVKSGLASDYNGKIPFKVTRTILNDNRLKVYYDNYIQINDEWKLAQTHFNNDSKIEMRPFLDKIYKSRAGFYKKLTANSFYEVLQIIREKMVYYKEQLTLVNYEVVETKKILLKKKVQPNVKITQVDNTEIIKAQSASRSTYEKSGKRYWPFDGEHWKDEVGNYKYFGENNCVTE